MCHTGLCVMCVIQAFVFCASYRPLCSVRHTGLCVLCAIHNFVLFCVLYRPLCCSVCYTGLFLCYTGFCVLSVIQAFVFYVSYRPLCSVFSTGLCVLCVLQAFGAVESMTDRICIHSNGAHNLRISAEDLLACCDTCGDGWEQTWLAVCQLMLTGWFRGELTLFDLSM